MPISQIQTGDNAGDVRSDLNSATRLNVEVDQFASFYNEDVNTRFRTAHLIGSNGYDTPNYSDWVTYNDEFKRLSALGFKTVLAPVSKTGNAAFISLDPNGLQLSQEPELIEATTVRVGTGASRINANAEFEDLVANKTRITWRAGGQLTEDQTSFIGVLPERIFVSDYPNDFTQSPWAVVSGSLVTISDRIYTGPWGANTAVKITDITGNATNNTGIRQDISKAASDIDYTFVAIGKQDDQEYDAFNVQVRASDNFSNRAFAQYNFRTGEFTTFQNGTVTLIDGDFIKLTDGYVLVWLQATVPAADTSMRFYSYASNRTGYTTGAEKGMIMAGAYCYEGLNIPLAEDFPSYTTAVTRGNDNIEMGSINANYPDKFSSTSGFSCVFTINVPTSVDSNTFFNTLQSTTDVSMFFWVRARTSGLTAWSGASLNNYPDYGVRTLSNNCKLGLTVDLLTGDAVWYSNGKLMDRWNDPGFIGYLFDEFNLSDALEGTFQKNYAWAPSVLSEDVMKAATSWTSWDEMAYDSKLEIL